MLTRLKVNGFKNLVDVDVYFGPFTCIAGANGVGKSNLFDAIRFLSLLADRPLTDAALSVRDDAGRSADVRSLFHRVGHHYDDRMSFLVEMLVPGEGVDDLGQTATATMTFLSYELELGLRDEDSVSPGTLTIHREQLTHIKTGEAVQHLLFPHSAAHWRRSVLKGRRTAPFISTTDEYPQAVIRIHADSGSDSGGRPLSRSAINLPRTVLSIANAAENPTALLARREMQSWRLLQLEPTALRRPDELSATPHVGADGSHLPATLYHLARGLDDGNAALVPDPYAQVANRLASLIDDVRSLRVDRDDRREILTLEVTDHAGTSHPARSLSDGSLRFLALAVLELDPGAGGLICLEEPENGIHPERIPAMLRLLQDIAVDVEEPVSAENPLRQVIVNTHSPSVVAQVDDDCLLVAELKNSRRGEEFFTRVVFAPLDGTWRAKAPNGIPPVQKGLLLAYLNPSIVAMGSGHRRSRRVIDRPDLQMMLPWGSDTRE